MAATRAPRRWVAVLVILTGAFATGASLGRLTAGHRLPGDFPVLDPSPPVRLTIPSLGVLAPVRPVGLAAEGTLAVPASRNGDEVGWYEQSPTPGQLGPAVLVGHVDTTTGPAVFHRLGTVRPGAEVEVTRLDRSVAVFEVTEVRSYDKASLPVDRLYGDVSRPALRLVTCGGRWVGGGTGYTDNVVVFASLVADR